jgi:hypothetical protein
MILCNRIHEELNLVLNLLKENVALFPDSIELANITSLTHHASHILKFERYAITINDKIHSWEHLFL